jgi:hypothetical protein
MSFSQRAIWKNSSTAVILLGLCSGALFADESSLDTGSASWREKIGLSGSFRLGEYYRDRSFSTEKGFLNGSVWGSLKPPEIAGFKPAIDLRAQGQNLTRSSSIDVNLREAFVEKSVGPFDFRVGRQIIVWGRADKVNPTDNLTSRDFSLLVTDDEDQRSGPFAAQAIYNVDSWRITGIWQPEWRPPVFPLGALPPGVSFSYGSPQTPHEQFSLKLDNSGGAIDWSFSFFHGVDRTPDLKVLSSGAAGILLELNFQKIDVLGADFATNLGSFGVRGEASYTRTQDRQGADPLTKNSNLFVVLGADRSFYETLNINAQYLYRHTEREHVGAAGEHQFSPTLAKHARRKLENQPQSYERDSRVRANWCGLVYDTGLPAPPQDHLCIFRHFSGNAGYRNLPGKCVHLLRPTAKPQ